MRMRPQMLLPCLVLCVLGVPVSTHRSDDIISFIDFTNTYNKNYPDRETEERRYQAFTSNLQYIEKHNTRYKRGNTSFYLALNAYADLTHEEFKDLMRLDVNMRNRTRGSNKGSAPSVHLPDSVDWRSKGYVTPVKNQGQCGSCWSFSSTGSMEGQFFKKTGKLVSLSEQQLVDCSVPFGNHGCKGGLMDNAFNYVQEMGLETEDSYPYTAKEGSCRYNKMLVVADCRDHVDVDRKESALQSAVATVGPVSVAIDANHRSFQHYSGGVYDEPACSSSQLDHGVLTVGYGTDPTQGDFWIVKNSWGLSWGQEGYIMMSRNKDNQCGIATQASYPLV